MKLRKVPASWEGFTPEFMTAIMARRYPDVVVAGVEILEGSEGTSSRAIFRLRYSSGNGPETVFAKTQGDWRHRVVHAKTGNLFNEARLFAPGVRLPIEHPLVYGTIVDRLRLNELLVMEDLSHRDVLLHRANQPISVDAVASGLRGLARLHSEYWRFSKVSHPDLAWIKPWRPTRSFKSAITQYGKLGMQRMVDLLPTPVAAQNVNEMAEWWARYVSSVGGDAMTLLHGDAHMGNSYMLSDGQVGFVDWAVVRRGNWVHDVGYFIISGLSVADRRAHDAELVEEYRKTLDVPFEDRPTTEQAWLRYRTTPPYGLAVWLATGGGGGWKTPEICSSFVERFANAFVDLNTASSLAELDPKSN